MRLVLNGLQGKGFNHIYNTFPFSISLSLTSITKRAPLVPWDLLVSQSGGWSRGNRSAANSIKSLNSLALWEMLVTCICGIQDFLLVFVFVFAALILSQVGSRNLCVCICIHICICCSVIFSQLGDKEVFVRGEDSFSNSALLHLLYRRIYT